MRAGAPLLVGVGGLSGSGKSTLAAALAPLIAPMPGARVLSSDRIRKALFGVAPTSRLPASAYTPDVSERVYAIARERARMCLEAGWPVICDAVFDRAADRAALGRIAAECHTPFHGVWLEASGDVLAARVSARAGDPSDATVDVLQAQQRKLAASGESLDWIRLDACSPASENAKRVRENLRLTTRQVPARAVAPSDRRPWPRRKLRVCARAGPHAMGSPQACGDNRGECSNP